MTYDIITAPQRSPEWRKARLGRLTGSSAADMLATIKSGEAAARRDLRLQLVTERLTGEPQDTVYVNADMQRGIDLEAAARGAYESATGNLVQESGFLSAHDLMVGCSLDGHIGDMEGICEIKCPKSSTHLRYLRSSTAPADHLAQITHNLWVSGAQWCDFVSFDDRFPEKLRLVIRRVLAEELDLAAYEAKARAFLAEVDTEEAALRGWEVLA